MQKFLLAKFQKLLELQSLPKELPKQRGPTFADSQDQEQEGESGAQDHASTPPYRR